MLRNTFVHIPGIGRKKEAYLWQRGITTWEQLLVNGAACQPTFPGFATPAGPLSPLDDFLRRSQRALDKKDAQFFGESLPTADYWRMLPDFPSSVAYRGVDV